MKRGITLLVLAFMMVLSVEAQYYYKPYTFLQRRTDHPCHNPGYLNADAEFPVGSGLPAGWTTIDNGAAASPRWTTVKALPFAFNLNGVPVTHYKVSTSGILTFDTATVLAAPAYANVAIPSALIPANSVMIWGLSGTQANDKIVTKTFGTAPNRQHWIFFNSYSVPGAATSCFSYWSIVLEETSNRVYMVDQRNGGSAACNPTLTIGVQIDNTLAYSVTGSPSVGDLAASGSGPEDNLYYEFINGTKPVSDAFLYTLTVPQFRVPPATVSLSSKLINFGSTPITAFDFKYDVGGIVYTRSLTGLNILSNATYTFSHTVPVNISAAGRYAIRAWVEVTGDLDHTNDSLNNATHGLSYTPPKKLLIEEGTGTWCGWCPRGTVYMDSLATVYPNTAMLIAVHNADPMAVTEYDAGLGKDLSGYPSSMIDRITGDIDPSDLFTYYNQRIGDKAPCEVDVQTTYDPVTRNLQATVHAHFSTALEGDYRFNAAVIEDDVTGTASTYAMTNYYSGSATILVGAGHNWNIEPNPIPAANMEYDHVARAILGGYDGLPSSLPVNIADGSDHYYTFSYTLPAGYDPNTTHVIGWVGEPVSGNVYNSNRNPGTIVGMNEPVSDNFEIRVYPNPVSSGLANLRINLKKNARVIVEVVDVMGRVVFSNTQKSLAQGEFIYPLNMENLSNGLYNVKVTVNDEQITKRVVLQQ